MITQAEACNTDTTPTQPHRNSNTHRTTNKTTNVVTQQNSRKFLMMDILMSETCWAHKKWNKIASDIKLVFYSSTSTNYCFIVSLLNASTCFGNYVLTISKSKLCYTASGVITPIGGRPVQPVHRTTTYRVWWYQMLYNTDLTSWWRAKTARNM